MTDGVLLIDLDGRTHPNLALMHISTWKKGEGYRTGWNVEDPSEVYASCVFDWHRHNADGLPFMYPNAKIDVGGGGIDLHKTLPQEVDLMMPDYDLYPGIDFDIGTTTKGCIRKCPFCVVPRKEGAFRIHQHPREFHRQGHRKIVLQDNNILADRDWFFEVTDWMLANKMKADFNQGLDLRLMTEEFAERIAELRPIDSWHFAFDSMGYRPAVERGIALLKKAGVDMRHKANVYVYLHDDADFDSALERCNILRGMQCTPYIMRNRNADYTDRMKRLKRWTRPQIFWSTDFGEYVGSKRRSA